MEVETHILSNLGAAPDLSYAIADELNSSLEKARCKKHEKPASIKFRKNYKLGDIFQSNDSQKCSESSRNH